MKSVCILAAAAAVTCAVPAQAEQGNVHVRARAILVSPTEKAGPVLPTFSTGSVSVTDSWAPEVDVTYFVKPHIGVELIAATTKHKVHGEGSLTGVGKVADTWVLPPTLTLQYHFAPEAKVRPYVGVGVNYTHFYSEKASSSLQTAIGSTAVHLKDSFGYDLQAGVDVQLQRNLFLNLDVKYLDIDTTARLTTGTLVNRVKVSLDPIVAGIGIGVRF